MATVKRISSTVVFSYGDINVRDEHIKHSQNFEHVFSCLFVCLKIHIFKTISHVHIYIVEKVISCCNNSYCGAMGFSSLSFTNQVGLFVQKNFLGSKFSISVANSAVEPQLNKVALSGEKWKGIFIP